MLGAGPVADAFFVAFRLPNHFRAILAEGAFNAAFVPAYARTLEQSGLPAARLFSDRIAAALLVINLFLLGLALVFTPSVVSLLAPGLDQDPTRYDLAVTLTRVTFPALLLVSMQTMISGELNANGRFAAAAGAPILLNICMVLTLSVAYWFPNAGLAAAWGVLSAGVAQVLLVGVDAREVRLRPQSRALPNIRDDFVADLRLGDERRQQNAERDDECRAPLKNAPRIDGAAPFHRLLLL